MGIKTYIFAGLLATCTIGALFNPIMGVLGYVGHYMIGPERQWWERPLQDYGIRYSYWLAILTFVGIAINFRRLRYGKSLFSGQEKLLLLFLAIAWGATLINPATVGRYTTVDHPSVKFTKIVIFTLMLTHVVTDIKKLNYLLWVLVIGGLILGLQAYDTPRRSFIGGRLNTVGGPDFSESNFLAAYLTGLLPIIAIQFIRSKWPGKIVCLISGAFTANAIVLTRSRGAFVGLAGGAIVALLLAPGKYRPKIAIGLILAALGGYYVSDPQFRQRMMTITSGEETRDSSAQSRVVLAKAGIQMFVDNPMGVGLGNFKQHIGRYVPQYTAKAAHNTYILFLAETGVLGISAFLAIILSGALSLRRCINRCHQLPANKQDKPFYMAYGMCVAIATLLGCALPITLTWTEGLWWFLMLPVCMARALDNYEADLKLESKLASAKDKADSDGAGPRGRPKKRPGRMNPTRT